MSFRDGTRERFEVIRRDAFLNGLISGLGGVVSMLINAIAGRQIYKPVDTSEHVGSSEYPGQ